ncbi:MAG: FAD-binding oxidoreductase [Cellulomonadaceae bacterium]
MTASLVDGLVAIVGAEHVLTGADELALRARDRSAVVPAAPALAVVRPASTAEVSAVLGAADEAGVPVVPQGALSGLAGAASALPGAVLLDLTRMDRVLALDEQDRTVTVQPGLLVSDLARTVAGRGLFYPPDPASAAQATIGGTIATNAGGMRCIKYGLTRDYVRSLEVVLANGTVVRTRAVPRKSVASLDLTGLVVGSEGTLAVVTEATLALLPTPGPERGVSATFASLDDAFAAAREVAGSSRLPATLELLDEVVLSAVTAYDPEAGIPAGAKAWLLAVTDAHEDALGDLAVYEEAFRRNGALRVDRADETGTLDALLRARRAFNPAMARLRGASINEDVSVPTSRLADVAAAIGEVARELGVEIGIGGHVGDGNLHPVIAYDPADPSQVAAAWRAHHRILELAPRFGGTITGEHGVGVEKLADLGVEVEPALREAERAIKRALDPRGTLNPGRKF